MSRFLKLLQAPQYSPLDLNDSESGAEEFEDSLENIPITQYPPSHVRSPKSNALYFRVFLRMAVILVGFSIITVIVRLRLRCSNAWVEKSDIYRFFPTKIARVSIKEHSKIYGLANRVDIGLDYQTLMEFPIPIPYSTASTSLCHIRSHLPYMASIGNKSYETWGDVSEIEVWRIPHHLALSINYGSLSYSTLPNDLFSRGELIALLDMQVHPIFASEDFECGPEPTLTVIFRCLRVACKAGWIQTDDEPQLGIELVRVA